MKPRFYSLPGLMLCVLASTSLANDDLPKAPSERRVSAEQIAQIASSFDQRRSDVIRRSLRVDQLNPERFAPGKWSGGVSVHCAIWLGEHLKQANACLQKFCCGTEKAKYQVAGGPSGPAWLYLKYGPQGTGDRLTPETEQALLDYLYRWVFNNSRIKDPRCPRPENIWVHSGGERGGSENHQTGKWAANYLSLSALAQDPQYKQRKLADGHTVQQHLEAWSDYLVYRIREWAKRGLFGEFGRTSGYGMVHLAPAFAIRDFPPSEEARQLADDFLTLRIADWMMAFTGSCLNGSSAVRTYKHIRGGSWPLSYLHYGMHDQGIPVEGMLSFFSDYRPPEVLIDLAWNRAAAGSYEYRMRPTSECGWSTFFWNRDNVNLKRTDGMMGQTHPGSIVRYSYATLGYTLSSFTQDPTRDPTYRPDAKNEVGGWEFGFQDIFMGATFPSGSRVMPCCVDPTYSGFGEFRGVGHKSVLIVQRNPLLKRTGDLGFFFAPEVYETRIEKGGWVFARDPQGTAFVAVKSSKGSVQGWQPVAKSKHVARHLKTLKDESEKQKYLAEHAEGHWVLFSDDALNQPMVLQMGLAKDYADFEAFMADVLDNPFRWISDTEFEYTGCGDAGTIVWNTSRRYLPSINSVPVNIYPARVYDSPYLKSYYNSGEVQIQDTTGRTLTLDFNEQQSN